MYKEVYNNNMNEYRELKKLKSFLIEKKDSIIVDDNKYVVGAFAFDNRGRLLSKGTNSFVKTHPRQKKYADCVGLKYKIYLHAEVSAIIKANAKIDTLIVARILQHTNETALAKPCPVCCEAIRQAGIKKVYFTNKNGELVLLEQKWLQ